MTSSPTLLSLPATCLHPTTHLVSFTIHLQHLILCTRPHFLLQFVSSTSFHPAICFQHLVSCISLVSSCNSFPEPRFLYFPHFVLQFVSRTSFLVFSSFRPAIRFQNLVSSCNLFPEPRFVLQFVSRTSFPVFPSFRPAICF